MASVLKRLLVGRPLASESADEQRLSKVVALAVFASDAISSTAYATEEILFVLVPLAALAALDDLIPIAIVVTILLAVVITSYRQTIRAYPGGGGSYVVSKDNLGTKPGLVAGAALLVDYTLTVSVSVTAGVAAITSAYPSLRDHKVGLCLAFIALLTFANLRGMKEAGRAFALPTYLYLVSLAVLLVIGLARSFSGDLAALPPDQHALDELTGGGPLAGIGLFALLRAFSSGAVALSGVEAISTGVGAFRKPAARNASSTLVAMGLVLGVGFLGISVLAHRLAPTASHQETILSVMGAHVFGDGSPLYLLLQFSTFGILILAANTSYSAFPLLSSMIAKDGFLPRQLHNRGDRLVYSNGIIALAVAASLLVVLYDGQTTRLIPLYAVGVFTGFTLSQSGMVRRHLRLKEPRWQLNAVINGAGAVTTGVVLAVVVVSKFTIGAWIPTLLIPLVVLLLLSIKKHYDRVERALQVPETYRSRRHTHTVVVLVGRLHRPTLAAISYARSLAPDRLVALSIAADPEEAEALQAQWDRFDLPVTLHIESSPYRELAGPVLAYLDELDAEDDNDVITVVLPEFVLNKWWEQLLHNQSALLLKGRLLFRRNTVVVSVPYHLSADGNVDVPGVMEAPAQGNNV